MAEAIAEAEEMADARRQEGRQESALQSGVEAISTRATSTNGEKHARTVRAEEILRGEQPMAPSQQKREGRSWQEHSISRLNLGLQRHEELAEARQLRYPR